MNEIEQVLELDYGMQREFFNRRLQRWARKRWPQLTQPLNSRVVWGYLLAAAAAQQLSHRREYSDLIEDRP